MLTISIFAVLLYLCACMTLALLLSTRQEWRYVAYSGTLPILALTITCSQCMTYVSVSSTCPAPALAAVWGRVVTRGRMCLLVVAVAVRVITSASDVCVARTAASAATSSHVSSPVSILSHPPCPSAGSSAGQGRRGVERHRLQFVAWLWRVLSFWHVCMCHDVCCR